MHEILIHRNHGWRFCQLDIMLDFVEVKMIDYIVQIGDKIKDKDGTVGTVTEIYGDRWIRYKFETVIGNNLSNSKKKIKEIWNLKRNCQKI